MDNLQNDDISELAGTSKGGFLESWLGSREFYRICSKFFYRKNGTIKTGDSIVNFPGGNSVEIYEVKSHDIGKPVNHFHCILVPKK